MHYAIMTEKEDGLNVPSPSSKVEYVEVAA